MTIDKADVTGGPYWIRFSFGQHSGKHLYDLGLSAEGGTFSVPGRVEWDEDSTVTLEEDKAYGWTFFPEDRQNYQIKTGTIVAWNSNVEIEGSVSGSELTYTILNREPISTARVIAARYDNGKMTDVQVIGAWTTTSPRDSSDFRRTHTFTMKGSGDVYKLFLVDGDGKPLCPAWSNQ